MQRRQQPGGFAFQGGLGLQECILQGSILNEEVEQLHCRLKGLCGVKHGDSYSYIERVYSTFNPHDQNSANKGRISLRARKYYPERDSDEAGMYVLSCFEGLP